MHVPNLQHRRVPLTSMAARRVPMRLPLWKRAIPKYPLYVEGGPQNRVFLCQFWMKLIQDRTFELPNDRVHFEIHPQMSVLDVKQYLEKIYNVDVLKVRSYRKKGYTFEEKSLSMKSVDKGKIPPVKVACVQLGGEHKFTFPNLVKEDKSSTEEDSFKMGDLEKKLNLAKNWERPSIPPWFG
ncbi:39S ribosomal protein L23, mitochondrial-like [Pecten maximus]|uniref:39S ribosomal protein L23, mitochondrial-like n=1 Tax=Pecten maximus TaxID=6579 RepID=UPI0014580111|nr:39S ribosomal protein L23, mitochondrial-like [Pecten maximus]